MSTGLSDPASDWWSIARRKGDQWYEVISTTFTAKLDNLSDMDFGGNGFLSPDVFFDLSGRGIIDEIGSRIAEKLHVPRLWDAMKRSETGGGANHDLVDKSLSFLEEGIKGYGPNTDFDVEEWEERYDTLIKDRLSELWEAFKEVTIGDLSGNYDYLNDHEIIATPRFSERISKSQFNQSKEALFERLGNVSVITEVKYGNADQINETVDISTKYYLNGKTHVSGSQSSQFIIQDGNRGSTLVGGALNDLISGGGGNDFILGFEGDDLMFGGPGKDIFEIQRNEGRDYVSDFRHGVDKIYFNDIKSLQNFRDVKEIMYGQDGNVVIETGDDSAVVLGHINQLKLDRADFIF